MASVSAVLRFWLLSLQNPHGQFDAYAIWNLHARFLYRGGELWKHFTWMTWSHPDYPLLLPASVARSWEFLGRETQLVPSAIGLLFTFATIGVVVTSISRLRGERQGLLAGLILLGTPFLITHGASQYADVPLGFFFVVTIALLFLHAESPSHRSFLVLAGMAAGFSAWTKNEGLLFSVLLFSFYCLVTIAAKGTEACKNEMAAILMGAAPPLVVIAIDKVCLEASNDVIAAQQLGSTVSNLLDPSRYHLVISQFAREVLSFGEWGASFSLPLLLFFYFLLLGASVEKKYKLTTTVAVLVSVFMMVGYFFVYIVTPLDLRSHLESSLNRLLVQVWPLATFAYFAIVDAPEQASIESGKAMSVL